MQEGSNKMALRKVIYIIPFIIFLVIPKGFSQPSLYIPIGNEYDFGDVGHTELHCKIPVINLGTDTLSIKSVVTSCGCTTAPIEKKQISPLDTSFIFVTLNTRYSKGIKESTIQITNNDSHDSLHKIVLKANIIDDIRFFPDRFPNPVYNVKARNFETAIKIINNSKEKIKLFEPLSEGDSINMKFIYNNIINPEDSIELKVIIDSVDLSKAIFKKVILPTTSKFNPFLEVSSIINQREIIPNRKVIVNER